MTNITEATHRGVINQRAFFSPYYLFDLLALFKLRGKTPPMDIVDFFAAAGADISAITGPFRDLERRVVEAARLDAVAYIPSGRGGEIEVDPEAAEAQLRLFEDQKAGGI